MAASCRRLSPYFTAAPGGDGEHRGEPATPRREERRGDCWSLAAAAAAWTTDTPPPLPLACQCGRSAAASFLSGLTIGRTPPPPHPHPQLQPPSPHTPTHTPPPPSKFEGFLATLPKPRSVMNDKPLSQIDFKLNQTLVFNYLSRCSRRGNLKVVGEKKERRREKKERGGGGGGGGGV